MPAISTIWFGQKETFNAMECNLLLKRTQSLGELERIAYGPNGLSDSHQRSGASFICGLLLGVVLCVFSSACRPSNSRTIAVIPRTTANELWESVHKGAERAGHETGFHIYWNAPTRE